MDCTSSSYRDRAIHSRFNKLSDKLFSSNTNAAVAVSVPNLACPEGLGLSERNIKGIKELRDEIAEYHKHQDYERIIFIPQEYTWSRLRMTHTVFHEIISSLSVFSDFLCIISAFGLKTSEDERAVYGVRACAYLGQCARGKHELCYNLPFVERHGRKLKDPWSLRQTCVYQQSGQGLNASLWVMVNVTKATSHSVKEFLKSKCFCCHSRIHAQLLLLHGFNWGEYVEYLVSELKKHDDKVRYSNVEQAKEHAFTVTCQDLQEMHMLRAKIERALDAIGSSIDVAQGCLRQCNTHIIEPNYMPFACAECLHVLEAHRVELSDQRQSMRRLEHRVQDILNLLSKILVMRNESLLQKSTRSSHDTLGALLTIAQQSKTHQDISTQLLGTVQADSVLLKALSIVSTVFLPASLIATVFSSNLIESKALSAEPEPTRLVLSPQFWIYIVISLPIMALTLSWTLYMDRRSHRKVVLNCTA